MPILECNQLSKSYGKVPALDGVSFAIEPGRIVGLLGPNGSGKTTLIKLANGLLTPSSGEILIDGRTPGRETHAMVSYLPERTAIPTWMSAGQLMDFYEDFYPDFRRQAAEEMLHHLNIQPKQRIKHPGKGSAHYGHEPGRPAVSAGRAHRRRGPRHTGLYSLHHYFQL